MDKVVGRDLLWSEPGRVTLARFDVQICRTVECRLDAGSQGLRIGLHQETAPVGQRDRQPLYGGRHHWDAQDGQDRRLTVGAPASVRCHG